VKLPTAAGGVSGGHGSAPRLLTVAECRLDLRTTHQTQWGRARSPSASGHFAQPKRCCDDSISRCRSWGVKRTSLSQAPISVDGTFRTCCGSLPMFGVGGDTAWRFASCFQAQWSILKSIGAEFDLDCRPNH